MVAIERGPWRDAPTDYPTTFDQDELRYRIRHELFLRPAQLTFTFRNKMTSKRCRYALGRVHADERRRRRRRPLERRDISLPADRFRRQDPSDATIRRDFLPADMTIQDLGVTYDDLEPYYDQFEYLCGTSGTAGNLQGQIIEGGNPFEGPRSRPYPNRHRRSRSATPCSPRPRASSAISRFRSPPATCRRPI